MLSTNEVILEYHRKKNVDFAVNYICNKPVKCYTPDMKEHQITPTARNNEMRRLKNEGWTYDKLAKKYDLTRARVHQIVKRAELKEHLALDR